MRGEIVDAALRVGMAGAAGVALHGLIMNYKAGGMFGEHMIAVYALVAMLALSRVLRP